MAGSLLDNETHATTNPRLYVKREAISSIHNRVLLTLPDAADILYGNNEYGSRRVDPDLFDSQYQGPHPQPVLSADSCHFGAARLYPALPGDRARGKRAVSDLRFRELEPSVGLCKRRVDRLGQSRHPRAPGYSSRRPRPRAQAPRTLQPL